MNTAGRVLFAAFSADGRLLVTASDDKSAQVWDAATGRPMGPPLAHTDLVVSAQFSPDGTRLATASKDSQVSIWDVAGGTLLHGPLKQGLFEPTVRFTPAGDRLAGYSSDDVLRFWDVATGQPVVGAIETGGDIYALGFSADGRRLITAVNDGVELWDGSSGEPIGDPLLRSGPGAVLSPDGERVLTETGRIYDLAPAGRPPAWLPRLANVFAGEVLNQEGALEPDDEGFGSLRNDVQGQLAQARESDWTKWGRWFLALPAAESASPFSSAASHADRPH
jgi:WD40 repeat protein